jgi:hypothetical protein
VTRKKRTEQHPADVQPVIFRPAPQGEQRGPARPRLFTVREYLFLNLLFDAFCIAQLVLARALIRETRGLYFFFGLLMVGFLVVSIFDYVYDRAVGSHAARQES